MGMTFMTGSRGSRGSCVRGDQFSVELVATTASNSAKNPLGEVHQFWESLLLSDYM